MRHTFYILTLLLSSITLFSQTSYSGYINKYPIELITNIYSDGDARAIYAYTNFDEPIVVNGRLDKNKLTLYEKDKSGKSKATLIFDKYNSDAEELQATGLIYGQESNLKSL
jgi:hypothetical protein